MEQITNWAHTHFQYILIGMGLLTMIGAVLKWDWIISMPYSKLTGTRSFIENAWSKEARLAFERWVTFAIGVLLVALGIFYLVLMW